MSTDTPTTPDHDDIASLRVELFATLRGLRNKSIDVATARAINETAGQIIDTARVEIEYLKHTDGPSTTGFLAAPIKPDPLPPGITSTTVHRIKG